MEVMKRLFKQSIFLLSILFLFSCNSSSPDKVYSIARDPTWFPLYLLGKQDNVFAFSDELVRIAMEKEKIHVDMVTANWDNLLYNLWKGHYDAVLTSLPPTAPNRALYDFSEEYLAVGDVLIVRVQDKVTSLADLKGKIVGVRKQGTGIFSVERFPSIIVSTYQNAAIALQDLANGKVDGVVMGLLPANTLVQNIYPETLYVATSPLDNQALRLVTLKDKNSYLIKSFDQGVNDLKESGGYDLILRKWGLYQ